MAELSGLEVAALVKEINFRLRDSYVNNVYSLGESHLLRFRRPDSDDALMVASPAEGVWISEKAAERGETSPFVSRLRGEISRAKFVEARQFGTDRIVELVLEGRAERRLVVEQMPPGNTIVTDAAGRVLLLQREVKTPGRRLVEGGTYAPPSQRRKDPGALTAQELTEMLRSEPTLGKVFGRRVALPRKYVAELLHRLGLEDGTPSLALNGREEEAVAALKAMVESAREDSGPCVCATDSGDEIFAVVPEAFEVKERAETLSSLCDELILPEVLGGASEGRGGPSQEEVALERLRKQSESALAEAARLRRLAEDVKRAPSLDEAVHLAGKGRKAARSQEALASAIFDEAKETESNAAELTAAARRLERKARAAKPETPALRRLERSRGEWYERFRWFTTSKGRLAIGGRDAQTNTVLVKRHLDENDTVYHADLFGSPFFILKGGVEQTPEEIAEVAQATASFSSAWKTGLVAADAYWVTKEQVSASAPSGEYLARGSFAITGKKNFVPRNPVQIAVGLTDDGRIVSGPESAISGATRHYVTLVPHREKASDTAKRVLKELERSSGSSLAGRLDSVVRALPSGGGKLVRRQIPTADKK